MKRTVNRRLQINTLLAGCLVAGGCIGPDPRYVFPLAPLSVERSQGAETRSYDADGDGKPDYRETLDSTGRCVALSIDVDGDGTFETQVDRSAPDAARRHLLIILDSVPYQIVQQVRAQGRLRLFYPPQRTIAPFPVMTDPSLAEFFGVSPCQGLESMYYDGKQLIGGIPVYLSTVNSPWLEKTDVHVPPLDHGPAYLYPGVWIDRELEAIQKRVTDTDQHRVIGYVVSSSGIGAKFGRDGHVASLVRIDCLSHALMRQTRGQLEITLMSDHGHNLHKSERALLARHLWRCGWHVTDELRGPRDVVAPEFGPVSCAAIYTHSPAQVAGDAVLMDAVDLCAFNDEDGGVTVLSRDGRATIRAGVAGFSYTPEHGDPLRLSPIIERLRLDGNVTPDGFIDDQELFDATLSHDYPDPLKRLWRAFHGLFVHTPDVLVSLREGYHVGDPEFEKWILMSSVHGNLLATGSSGFVMTTAGAIERPLRMEDLGAALRKLGVPLDPPATTAGPTR